MRAVLPGDEAFPYRGPGWDLRDEPPEEAPVVTYRLSPEEIAARYGPPQPQPKAPAFAGAAYALAKPIRPMTRDVLRKLAAEGLTAEEIAERLGRTPAGVRLRAKQWGVKLVDPGEAKPAEARPKERPANWEEELRRLYVEEGRSLAEIGRMYGLSDSTIAYHLEKYGIARRASGRASARGAEPQRRDRPDARVGISLNRTLSPEEAGALVHRVAEIVHSVAGLVPAVRVEIRVEAAEKP